MITLLASIVGFISSSIPQLLKLWQDKKDKEHEITLLRIQMEREEKGYKYQLEAIEAQGEIAADIKFVEEAGKASEVELMSTCDSPRLNVLIIIANTLVYVLTKLVRPVVTYAFFGLYAAVKVEIYTRTQDILKVWTEEDMVLFAATLSFWFSSRMLSKYFMKGKV